MWAGEGGGVIRGGERMILDPGPPHKKYLDQ
jgi:hypothetical protein